LNIFLPFLRLSREYYILMYRLAMGQYTRGHAEEYLYCTPL